jgi:hypothetical protein
MYRISNRISNIHASDGIISGEMTYPYYKKQLCLLSPWLIHLDSDASNRIDKLTNDQMYYLLRELCHTELCMAMAAINRNRDIASCRGRE